MNIIETPLPGVLIVEPKIFGDERGYFYESFNLAAFSKHNLPTLFWQDNISRSVKGVLRGLHYQLNPYAQGKLVRVSEGEVFDVAVDLRKNSPTFGKWFGLTLSAENKKQLWIPPGFAHGFCVTSDFAVFNYKATTKYAPSSERAILWNDAELGIEWPKLDCDWILSEKDKNGTPFSKAEMNFH
ncbi:dTDP-4-dehydrorhamnose 3,5-epimerase [Chloroherpeton thalassium ATCC 35110]|uniref:dTDP-4-dehydrorhamnose 3,5-epimerase n=1 Tax=Chloroherpeton thalassium (strain ATCC 35110 / GB-78) TaxID=517418 RepID=B3QXB4_CHLT3|nr:dTDP-4-dehydrorhamnose 3,5-epimerase [Chloroherpeton thalassium]ACF13388.1 dTDP-4-dehydrorhamnose 3,5-epimerase [Chloroherpeton thalassium ATCC 35110]